MIDTIDKSGTGKVDFESFCSMMNREFLQASDHDGALLQAFQTFSQGQGHVTGLQLEQMLNQIMRNYLLFQIWHQKYHNS